MKRRENDSDRQNDVATPARPAYRLRALAGRLPLIPIAVVALVVVGLGLLAFSLSGSNNNPLYPILPTFTPLSGTADFQAQEVNFPELNGDPAAFRDRRIQVSGTYTPLSAPDCLDYTGPIIRWSLVSEELQLNAVGFENLLRLVAEGIDMTVTGTWRMYHGPLGCGKEPVDEVVWYLEVDRILEPNPLQGAINPALTVVVGSPEFPAGSTPDLSASPDITATVDSTEIISPTATLDIGGPISATPALTPTTALPVTPLPTIGTPDPLATPDLTATTTVTVTGTIETTPGAEGTPPPSLPTNTPSGPGYPGGTAEPTAPPGGYP